MKTFSLPQLCTELDLSPKTARANLRKMGYKRPGTRWVWPIEKKSEIKAAIRGKSLPVAAAKKSTRKRGVSEAHVH